MAEHLPNAGKCSDEVEESGKGRERQLRRAPWLTLPERRLHGKQPAPRGRPLLKIIESLEKSERYRGA